MPDSSVPTAGANGSADSKTLSREQFAELVHHTITQRHISDREVDLLYRVFDTNRDGFLSLAEIVWTDKQAGSGSSSSEIRS